MIRFQTLLFSCFLLIIQLSKTNQQSSKTYKLIHGYFFIVCNQFSAQGMTGKVTVSFCEMLSEFKLGFNQKAHYFLARKDPRRITSAINTTIEFEKTEKNLTFIMILVTLYYSQLQSAYNRGNKQMSFNILQESDTGISVANCQTKLHFLQKEKNRLEAMLQEIEEQLKIQRHVNVQLSKIPNIAQSQTLASLLDANCCLERQYLRIKKQNQELSSALLIHQQLINQNQLECNNAFRSYEEKIIQLRRLIQLKESYIQNMETKYKFAEERVVVPSNNVTILFFSQIQELKKTISTLSFRNKELQYENKTLKSKNEQNEKKLHLLESLALKSKLTFEQLKSYYNIEQKTRKSAPKRATYIPLNQKLSQLSMKKLNQAQTRQCSEYSCSSSNAAQKMLLYKYVQQIQKLKENLNRAANQASSQRQAKGKLVSSYKDQQKRLEEVTAELNYYKKSTRDLMNIIACKRHSPISKSLQKSKQQQFLNSIKQPVEINEPKWRNKYWKQFKSTMKIQGIKVLQIKRKYKGFYRSLSLTTDYRRLNVDSLTKTPINKQQISKKHTSPQRYNISDFSMMIDSPSLDNISFIRQNKRKTLTQWKKQSKKQSLFNLTIFQQDIL